MQRLHKSQRKLDSDTAHSKSITQKPTEQKHPIKIQSHPQAILAMQRQYGNKAVRRILEAPAKVIQREGDYPEWVNQISEDLINMGIKESEVGFRFDIMTLGEAKAKSYLGILKEFTSNKKYYPVGGGGRSIIYAWNGHKDDLGAGDKYASILHYMKELNHLSQVSMGMDWLPAMQYVAKNSYIRFAGANFIVHPRVLYFAAAAQIGMNEAAGLGSKGGNYIVPGAVFEEIRLIHSAARLVEKRAGKRHAVEGSIELFNNLMHRLKHVVAIRDQQLAQQAAHEMVEHNEPKLIEFLTTDRLTRIKGLAEASSEEEAADGCAEIVSILGKTTGKGGDRPYRRHGHGWGSTDPHGTHHAMGTAMDVYYGIGPNARTNFAPPKQAWDYIRYLIQQHAIQEDASRPELSPQEKAAITAKNAKIESDYPKLKYFAYAGDRQLKWGILSHPDFVMQLDTLLKTHSETERASLAAGAEAAESEVEKDLKKRYKRLFGKIATGLHNRRRKIRSALSKKWWYGHAEAVRGSADMISEYLNYQRVLNLKQERPAQVMSYLQEALALFTGFELALGQSGYDLLEDTKKNRKRAKSAAKYVNGILPNMTKHNLFELQDQLQELLDEGADAAFVHAQQKSVYQDLKSHYNVRKWLDKVQSEDFHMVDHPKVFVAGLDSVKGMDLESTHHWEIAEMGMLTNVGEYQSQLDADMQSRSPDQMQQILQIMAHSPAGYGQIFSNNREDKTTPVTLSSSLFGQSLQNWADKKVPPVDVHSLISQVHENLPEDTGNPAVDSLVDALYSRGFYDVASNISTANKKEEK